MMNPAMILRLAAVAALFCLVAIALAASARPAPAWPLELHPQLVTASWYGGAGEHLARHTANGERFRPDGFTAAHRTLPFGTHLRVIWRGRAVTVTINDRGPARATGRGLDLSRGAARALGMIGVGVARVVVVRLD
jgi:rare lipoprotein A